MTNGIRLLAAVIVLPVIMAGISLMSACGGEPDLTPLETVAAQITPTSTPVETPTPTPSEIMAIVHECLDQNPDAPRGELRQVFLEGAIDYYARSAQISYEDAIVPVMKLMLEVEGCASH